MSEGKRDQAWFDDWVRRAKMMPVAKIHDEDGAILVADTREPIMEDGKLIYRTAYAIERDGVKVGAYENYRAEDYIIAGREQGLAHRISEAVEAARELKRSLSSVDYWDWVHG